MLHRPAVLVVSDDHGLSDQVGAWLEEAGLEVLFCPGPGSGGCVGLSGHRCALERAVDAVVLDLHPSGDSFVDASRRNELAHYYSICGKPVLVLTDDIGQPEQPGAIGAATLGRFADRQQVTVALQELTA
jgi:DNA-binding response OmpR family regulator